MNTGGTPDIIRDRATGLLSLDQDAFARDLRTLADDERLRRSIGTAARADVHARFASTTVVARIEEVYHQVLPSMKPTRMTPPLRVAVVARAVMPMHGFGGLERSVRDLVRHLAAEGLSGHADRAAADGATRCPERPVRLAAHSDPSRLLCDVPAGQPAGHDGARSHRRRICCMACAPAGGR